MQVGWLEQVEPTQIGYHMPRLSGASCSAASDAEMCSIDVRPTTKQSPNNSQALNPEFGHDPGCVAALTLDEFVSDTLPVKNSHVSHSLIRGVDFYQGLRSTPTLQGVPATTNWLPTIREAWPRLDNQTARLRNCASHPFFPGPFNKRDAVTTFLSQGPETCYGQIAQPHLVWLNPAATRFLNLAGVTCTPSTPAPARKRRRPNQDLQERLARCEELLKQYANGSGPTTPVIQPSTLNGGSAPETPASTLGSGTSSIKWSPAGKVVTEDSGVRFMDNYLWASVYDELRAMKDIVETDDPDELSVLGSEDLSPENNTDFFFPGESQTVESRYLHPEPAQVFRLWQLYVDRVNPLTKVIHVPTVQPYVMEAVSNMTNIPMNYQALLFSIYIMASISLSEIECSQMLGISREEALRRFTAGLKLALTRVNFLKNHDMPILQALVLYLCSLSGRYDRHAAWILSGTVLRIAQKMGYHRDGELFDLLPFETEMRRRIWWQIILQDAKNAVTSGLTHSMLPSNWDTKEPQNLNDADLIPGSTEPFRPREGPTEMGFCLLLYQMSRFIISIGDHKGLVGFDIALLGQNTENDKLILERWRVMLENLEQNLMEIERRYIDISAGAVHAAALGLRPLVVSKLKEMLVPMQEQPEWGTEILSPKDNLFKQVIMNNEHSTDQYDQMAQSGFLWFSKLHLQLDVLAVMTGQLCQRPMGSLSDRAWRCIEKIYTYHPELSDMSQKQYAAQAQLTLRAWRAREQAFNQAGMPAQIPSFLCRLRDVAPSPDTRSSARSSVTPPAQTHQTGDLDQLLGGYLDTTSINWDMWGDLAANQDNRLSVGSYAGFDGSLAPHMGGLL
ncbi:transcription factor [Paramyrothecium foliicola]|nr:transcription factor [Paramyrothecium foliicola]